MSDTQAETEAPLPWTEQHLKSALINLIEAAKNSVRGPERGGSENAVSGVYQQIVAAWNTRAQPKPDLDALEIESREDGFWLLVRGADGIVSAVMNVHDKKIVAAITSLRAQLAAGDAMHAALLAWLSELMDAKPDTPEFITLKRLSDIIEPYETVRWPIGEKT